MFGSSSTMSIRRGISDLLRLDGMTDARDDDREAGAAAAGVLAPDAAAFRRQQTAGNRQAHAAAVGAPARRRSPVKTIEQSIELGGVQPDAMVPYRKAQSLFGNISGDLYRRRGR